MSILANRPRNDGNTALLAIGARWESPPLRPVIICSQPLINLKGRDVIKGEGPINCKCMICYTQFSSQPGCKKINIGPAEQSTQRRKRIIMQLPLQPIITVATRFIWFYNVRAWDMSLWQLVSTIIRHCQMSFAMSSQAAEKTSLLVNVTNRCRVFNQLPHCDCL